MKEDENKIAILIGVSSYDNDEYNNLPAWRFHNSQKLKFINSTIALFIHLKHSFIKL